MSTSSNLSPHPNLLLAALPLEDYQRLTPHFKVKEMVLGQMIFEAGEPIEYVYFPHRAMISLVAFLIDGSTVETGLIGKEGMAGIQSILGGNALPYRALVQVPGAVTQLPVDCLKAEFERGGALQKILLRYMQVLLVQTAQSAVCNRMHSLGARLVRCLLSVQDGTGLDELPLTQESIAQMLGVRRAGVTMAAIALQESGLIQYHRGTITIVNREKLEARACGCHMIIQDTFDQLLGQR
jgi:CRP-like cAMP-binding protein